MEKGVGVRQTELYKETMKGFFFYYSKCGAK